MMKWLSLVVLGLLVPVTAVAQTKALTAVDYEEIRALYSRYVYGYDSGDAQMVASVLASDATITVGGNVIGNSREKIIAGIKPRVGLSGVRHIPTNILIEPSPEGAKGMQYLMLMSFQDGKAPSVTSGGVYRDVIVKTAEGWRFKNREVSWFSTPPAPPNTAP